MMEVGEGGLARLKDGPELPGVLAAHGPLPARERDEPRLVDPQASWRRFRESSFAALLHQPDPFARFWFRDLRRLALLLALVRRSSWLRNGKPASFALGSLAAQAKMSIARTAQVLDMSCGVGDFHRCPCPDDLRQSVFEPTPATQAAVESLVARLCQSASSVLGCPDPFPALTPLRRRTACIIVVDALHACLVRLDLEDRSVGSLTFLVAMLDLYLHSPVATADFVRREASRLRVTTMTLRNVLRRGRQRGWVQQKGRMVTLAPAAEERIPRVLADGTRNLARLLEEIASS